MKCANPECFREIGPVAYRRGWFSKRRYCSKHCRDAFVADASKGSGLQLVDATFNLEKTKSVLRWLA